jgi:hypothetical protein
MLLVPNTTHTQSQCHHSFTFDSFTLTGFALFFHVGEPYLSSSSDESYSLSLGTTGVSSSAFFFFFFFFSFFAFFSSPCHHSSTFDSFTLIGFASSDESYSLSLGTNGVSSSAFFFFSFFAFFFFLLFFLSFFFLQSSSLFPLTFGSFIPFLLRLCFD